MGIEPPLFWVIYLITSVDLFLTGRPDNPPDPILSNSLMSVTKSSLEIVVFVAIKPSIFVEEKISIISSSWVFDKSGAIFNNIGLGLEYILFLATKDFSKCSKGSFS